ncbi:MAG: DMT family transporter [Chloroflexi bacterium]|nr:MAG: DMT family transporter [Chloroflexota bacterium]
MVGNRWLAFYREQRGSPSVVGWTMALASTGAAALVTPLARSAVSGGLDPLAMLLARLVIAVVLMALTLGLTRPSLLHIDRALAGRVALVGGIAGVEICCFFLSLAWIDSSMSAMLKSVQPLAVLLLLAFGGERLTHRHLLRLLFAFAGIYLLVGPSGQHSTVGLILTGLSILLYAIQLVLLQWRLLGYDPRTVTFYLLLMMTLVVALFWAAQGGRWSDPGVAGWSAILVMAVVSTYFARIAQFVAMRHIGGGQIALLWPVQTLLIILLSVFFLHERLTLIQWAGGLLVLVSAGLAVQRNQPINQSTG